MYKIIVLIAFVFLSLSCKNSAKEAVAANEESNKLALSVNSSKDAAKVILCFGNSLTAGYGLENEEAYPEVLDHVLDSLGYDYVVVNSGVSGETTSGGLNRIDWVMKQPVDIFILELGANDGLRGIATAETKKNLEDIIMKVKAKSPGVKILLAGMQMPPSMGFDYADDFKAVFPAVAEKTDVTLIPFFLENVGGHPDLNQADGMHPNAEGTKIVVENVMRELKGILQ